MSVRSKRPDGKGNVTKAARRAGADADAGAKRGAGDGGESADELALEIKQRTVKYQRGAAGAAESKKVRSAKEKATADHARRRQAEAAEAAARSEVLLTETGGYLEAEGMERTFKFTQKQLAENVDISSASKIFDLKLGDFGPYAIDYSGDGRRLLLGGRKGHLATVDWRNAKLGCELHVRETVRDVCWLHNEMLFAVAQKKYAYIYDHTGAEVHCLRKHEEPTALGFLRHHFLLASTGMNGRVVYQDVTEGKVVGEHRSGFGPAHVLRVNPYNAVVHVGHGNGTVTLWAPQQSQPLAKLLCHKGPVQAVAVDGVHMATSGLDGQVKVWDVRALRVLHEYATARPAQSLDISQRGLLAAGCGPHVVVWKDALATCAGSPYMRRMLPATSVQSLRFAPYEDVLGYGHSGGMSSMLVPGAGEPNFDALVANPFQTAKQRQEAEVKLLLDKLPADTIQLDPTFIGRLDPRSQAEIQRERLGDERARYAENKAGGMYRDGAARNRTKGRNSTAKRYNRKRQTNVTDLKKLQELERMERDMRQAAASKPRPAHEAGALGSFYAEKARLDG